MDLKNAKVIGLSPNNLSLEDERSFIKGKEYVLINTKKDSDRYRGWSNNDHHFTTEFHRRVVIPALSQLLDFEFKPDEYHIVENIAKTKNGDFDISYYAPNDENYRFDVTGLEYDIHYEDGFKGLLFNEENKKLITKTGPITSYHKIYAFPHSCSIVKNLYKHNDRTLLVLGDSQAIPFIPLLCTIFKEVWYFDNRSDKSFKDLLESTKFDDILVEIWKRNMEYYTVKNLK